MSRTSLDTARRRAGVIAAAAVVTALGAGSARADQNAPGIWQYNCDTSITVFNLTLYEWKSDYNSVVSVTSDGSTALENQCAAPLIYMDALPFRSFKWDCNSGSGNVSPPNWDGKVLIQPVASGGMNSLKDYSFYVALRDQGAHGLVEDGTWFFLLPVNASVWSIPATADTWAYRRWATTINDNTMHNIMTLIGPRAMVAMYSPDNKNIVVVIQQFWESYTGWDDSSHFDGWELDWVDNDGSTVPR